MPSGEVAAVVPLPIARNTVPFQITNDQVPDVMVLFVQVMPSGEVAATVPDVLEMAQKTVPFQAIEFHWLDEGNVRWVQVIPSGLV